MLIDEDEKKDSHTFSGKTEKFTCKVVRATTSTEIKALKYENLLTALKTTKEELVLEIDFIARGKNGTTKQWVVKESGWIGDWFDIR